MEFEILGTKFQVLEWSALVVLEIGLRRVTEVEGCTDNNDSSFELHVILLHLLKLTSHTLFHLCSLASRLLVF